MDRVKWMSSFELWGNRLSSPPTLIIFKVHAAFAKVLHLYGAVEYMKSIEWDVEMEGTIWGALNGKRISCPSRTFGPNQQSWAITCSSWGSNNAGVRIVRQ